MKQENNNEKKKLEKFLNKKFKNSMKKTMKNPKNLKFIKKSTK